VDNNTGQIEHDIKVQRGRLDRNLEELEQRVHDIADWRVQFGKRPGLFLGAAVGAGVVFGLLAGSDDGRPSSSYAALSRPPLRERNPKAAQLLSTWDRISDALLGLATAKVIDTISDSVPGFRDHYDRRNDPAMRRPTAAI